MLSRLETKEIRTISKIDSCGYKRLSLGPGIDNGKRPALLHQAKITSNASWVAIVVQTTAFLRLSVCNKVQSLAHLNQTVLVP